MATNDESGASRADSGSQGDKSQNKGEGQKKYLGKYDSLDEVVEKEIGGLQKGFHETRTEISQMRELLEGFVANNGPGIGQPQRGPVGEDTYSMRSTDYGRSDGSEDPEDAINPQDFILDPRKSLKQINNAREARLLKANRAMVSEVVNAAMAVSDFKRDNPDLVEHEPIVAHFMNNQVKRDPKFARASTAKQLAEAAKLSRNYIRSLRNGKRQDIEDGRSPNTEEYTEGPEGLNLEGEAERGANIKDEGTGNSDDDTLASYLAERKAFKGSRFAPKQ